MGALWRVIWRKHWHQILYWAVAFLLSFLTFLPGFLLGGGYWIIAALSPFPLLLFSGGNIPSDPSQRTPAKMRKWMEDIWQEALDE